MEPPDDLSLAAAREVMGWELTEDEGEVGRAMLSAREPVVYRDLFGTLGVARRPHDLERWRPAEDIAQALEVATRAMTIRGEDFHLYLSEDGVHVGFAVDGGEECAEDDCAPEDRLKVAARLITSAAVRMVRAAREKEETP